MKICEWCGKQENAVAKMISGPRDRQVCNECIQLMVSILLDSGIEIDMSAAQNYVGPKP